MTTHPEITRLIAAERVRELHAQATADRLAAQVRRSRPHRRSWLARLPKLHGRRIALPVPVRAQTPRSA
jgi:hypothetical protein